MMDIDYAMLERIAEQRRFEARTLDIAKRLFIHRENPKAVSTQYGVNLARVYAIRKEVLGAAQALALPAGWEELRLAGPRDVIETIKRQFDDAMSKLEGATAKREKPSP
jgi:hypothetical protein